MNNLKTIPGFEDYSATYCGKIYSHKSNKFLKPFKRNLRQEYLAVSLGKGKFSKLLVHRLIAKTFLPNPKNLPQINHLDGNPKNNAASNLEWCDASKNQIHAYKEGLREAVQGSRHPNAKLNEKQVLEIRKLANAGVTTKQLSLQFQVSRTLIKNIKNYKCWKHI